MQGLKYILKVSGSTLLVVFVLVFGLRGCGLSRDYSAHDHPLLAEPKPWALIDLQNSSWEPLNWSSADVPLWTVEPSNLELLLPEIAAYASSEPGAVALALPSNAPGFSDNLVQHIRQMDLGVRMIFLSPHDGLIRDLRKDLPEALFSLGMADSTQFYLLHTFFLESLAQFSADFLVVTSEFLNSRGEVPKRVSGEIHRRQKSLLFDLRKGGDSTEFWMTPADGYLLPHTHEQLDILRRLRTKEGGQEGL